MRSLISNFLWRLLERCGAQGVTFIVSIVLARLLAPEVYGTVALVTVFTNILSVFVDSGFGTALVQKKDADDLDFSTIFYFNIGMCLLLYAVMFFCAPAIARFYSDLSLVPVIRVMSLTLVISGVKNIQQAYVSRNMLFKRFFYATLGGTVGAAIIGIAMAYLGFGVWALVVQQLFNAAVDTIILWITVKWRPKRMFSFFRLKGLFTFGWKLLVSSLLTTGYDQLRSLIIGKKYSSSDLAFFNKGMLVPNAIVVNVNSSIDSVLLPAMSADQDDRSKVRDMARWAIKTSTYLMMPLMTGLAICAEPLVSLVLTDKWLPCVPYLRIFCFTYAFYPIHTANLSAIKALGRSDYFLRLEIIKKLVGLTAIGISMWFGVTWMAYSCIITSVLSQIINAYPNKKLLDYSYPDQLRDMMPQIGMSCAMGVVVYCVIYLELPDLITLLIQVPLGALIYIAGSKLFHIDSFDYLLVVLKTIFNKNQQQGRL